MQKSKMWAALFVLTGLVVVFLSLYLGKDPSQPGAVITHWQSTLVDFFEAVGLSLIGMGIFSVLLDTKDWRDFFEERIKAILIDQDYFSRLDNATLKLLKTKLFQAIFKNTDIGRQDGLLNYFDESLHRYIGEPYRQDVHAEIFQMGEKDGGLEILDKVTYVCHSPRQGEKIQEDIRWLPDDDEFVSIDYVEIKVQYPYNHSESGQIDTLKRFVASDIEITSGTGVKLSLDKYSLVDGLVVTVESKYIKKQHFQYWQMAHPTKTFTITVNWVGDFEIQHKSLVLEQKIAQITEGHGYFKMRYDSWMLPQSGMAWRLISKTKKD
jgi:hypothetical protein